MIKTSIKLSIEVENGDETEKDEFLKAISYMYHYEFVKKNSGSYGNKVYFQYILSPVIHHNIGRKRKLSPEEESEVRSMHFETGFTISELVSIFGVSKSTICRTFSR